MNEFIKTDFHVHPNYSFDATREPIGDYCEKALVLGLSQICFTPHYTTVPSIVGKYGFVRKDGQKFPVTGDWLDSYLNEVRLADKKYSRRGLRVFAGLEVDYCEQIHDALKKRLIEEYRFDFLLGSIHVVKSGLDIMVPEDANELFRDMELDEFFEDYFDSVEKTIDSGLFKAIAHIEGYRRYGTAIRPEYGSNKHIPAGRFERAFKKMAAKNMALEINLALFRHNLNIINPVEEVLKIARDCGVTYVTFGSDAHRVADLALRMEEAEAARKKLGFKIYTI